jgi:hypothetical protein
VHFHLWACHVDGVLPAANLLVLDPWEGSVCRLLYSNLIDQMYVSEFSVVYLINLLSVHV